MGALTEVVEAFRQAWSRAGGGRVARDYAAALATLARGFTPRQVEAAWIEVDPAMKTALAYVRSVIAQARAALKRRLTSSSNSAPPSP